MLKTNNKLLTIQNINSNKNFWFYHLELLLLSLFRLLFSDASCLSDELWLLVACIQLKTTTNRLGATTVSSSRRVSRANELKREHVARIFSIIDYYREKEKLLITKHTSPNYPHSNSPSWALS